MKKTKYDLSIFELGLKTRAFYDGDVLNLLYGRYEYEVVNRQTEYGWQDCSYNWTLTNFQTIPMPTRRKMVTLLFKSFDIISDVDGLREEFDDRILCTLRTILEEEFAYKQNYQNQMQYDVYNCYFEDLIYPSKVMKEFLMWHRAGLPVSQEERKLLNDCVTKFLSESAPLQGTLAQRIEWKKAKWHLQLKKLNKKASRCYSSLNKLHKRKAQLEEKGKIIELSTVRAKIDKIRDEVLYKIYNDQLKYERELALAEAYPILTGNFPPLELLLSPYNNQSEEKAC